LAEASTIQSDSSTGFVDVAATAMPRSSGGTLRQRPKLFLHEG
jgi:hypothetical protein